ncbi:hypothetical protein [Baekduia sp. Peel2402]|uniref:hypothetical protein n=1 Tax=Baekduia sp. Peel2402 TaxID=3458296 RepID=UPI00403E40A4
MIRAAADDDAGQSSVELLGLLPLIALVALCLAQLLATGAAHTAATSAAEAAAEAVLQHTGDPAAAAHAAAPSWSRDGLTVRITGRHIRVRLRPRTFVPGTARLLVVTAEADAGPGPTAASRALPRHAVRAGHRALVASPARNGSAKPGASSPVDRAALAA